MAKTILVHNVETGEVIERDMTADELASYQIEVDSIKAEIQAKAEKEIAKTALLAKLGITEDEAKLLLL